MESYLIKLLVGFFVSLFILQATVRILPKIYSIRFFSGYYTFQFAAIFVNLILNPETYLGSPTFQNLKLRNYIDEGILAFLLFQIGVLFAVVLAYFMIPTIRQKPFVVDQIKSEPNALKIGLYFTALILLAFPFVSKIPGVGYAAAILFNFLQSIPFAAGVFFFKDSKVRLFWLLALATLFVLGILTGGRGTAMTALSIYALGFFYALETKKAKRYAIIAGIAIGIPLMSFMAFVGIFRHMVGRVDFDKINYARAIKVYNKYEKLKNTKALRFSDEEKNQNGAGRFVNYVNFVQLATVPNRIPHKGLEGVFTTDIKYSFDVSFLSGTTIQDRIKAKFANWMLNDYGFYVTEHSSVEFSILTESYIRFGYGGIFFYALTIALFVTLLEYSVYRWFRKYTTIQIFATLMICMQSLLGYAYPEFVIMRNLIITVFIAVFLVCFLSLLENLGKLSKVK